MQRSTLNDGGETKTALQAAGTMRKQEGPGTQSSSRMLLSELSICNRLEHATSATLVSADNLSEIERDMTGKAVFQRVY